MCKIEGFYDELAVRNSYDAGTIVTNLTIDQVVLFLRSLGVEELDVHDDYIVCPTICHNPIDEAESMKLYYYDKTKNFHCYTQCSENFNIISLYQKYTFKPSSFTSLYISNISSKCSLKKSLH